MKITNPTKSREQGTAIIAYLLTMMIVVTVIGGVLSYVSSTVNMEHRRSDMAAAQEFAMGGAVVACDDLNQSFTSKTTTFPASLVAKGYALDTGLSNSTTSYYKRTISTPFTSQNVLAVISFPASKATSAQITASATRGKVTQSATVNLSMSWGYPAAIISTNQGTNATGYSSSVGKAGNVAINGDKTGPIIVDGGDGGNAILANGNANVDYAYATVTKSAVSANNYGTANEVPDYTAQGTDNALFDFNRFTAVADSTPNTLSDTGTNHFQSLASFLKANAKAAATAAGGLEGVIVVEIKDTKDAGIDVLANPDKYVGTAYMPATNPQKKGITVKGTLFFNFGPSYGPLDKIFNRTAMNINQADLSGLKASDPTTYPSGYPPVYTDPTKNPINIDISSKGYTNFSANEDLPAVMYSIGTVDMHGPVNISGVVYTPSYSEIEDRPNEGFKVANQIQYIKGSIIVGLGLYFENTQVSTSIISYDSKTLDSLATVGNAGKKVKVTYWQ